MTDPYLILHKVRGEPAFDIAERTVIAGETAWVVSTSGHRAYPFWVCLLAQFGCGEHDEEIVRVSRDPYEIEVEDFPPGWPDHYPVNTVTKPLLTTIDLKELGL